MQQWFNASLSEFMSWSDTDANTEANADANTTEVNHTLSRLNDGDVASLAPPPPTTPVDGKLVPQMLACLAAVSLQRRCESPLSLFQVPLMLTLRPAATVSPSASC